jgi:hypothetical protein
MVLIFLSFNFGFPVNSKEDLNSGTGTSSVSSSLVSISSNGCSAISAAKSPKSVASSVASSSSCVSLSAISQLRHYEILAVFLRSHFNRDFAFECFVPLTAVLHICCKIA